MSFQPLFRYLKICTLDAHTFELECGVAGVIVFRFVLETPTFLSAHRISSIDKGSHLHRG